MKSTTPIAPLAAIGILSHGGNHEIRDWIRQGWLSPSAAAAAHDRHGIIARFVLRGIGAPPSQREEASRHGDVVFVEARHDLGRFQGPLHSLFLWWRAACDAWPSVAFIGKADDDTYLNLPGIANHLLESLSAVSEATRSAQPRIYWGAFEQYSFDETRHVPLGFLQDMPRRCKIKVASADIDTTNVASGSNAEHWANSHRGSLSSVAPNLSNNNRAERIFGPFP